MMGDIQPTIESEALPQRFDVSREVEQPLDSG